MRATSRALSWAAAVIIGGGMLAGLEAGAAVPSPTPAPSPAPQASPTPSIGQIYVREYRVQGAHHLDSLTVGQAVYPYLGPGRTVQDIEQAGQALEKAYHDKGYQTVSVQVPQQNARSGVIVLQVIENKVGRLRVRGARYYLPSQIKAAVPGLAEGTVLNFNEVTKEIIALNQLPGRRVTPALKPGEIPGTVDIDLNVEDKLPLHGSLSLDNRYSAYTPELRLNASLSYDNLWQLGHSAGVSFQTSPQDVSQVQNWSAYYIARFANPDWPSLMIQAAKQNSSVSTLGDVDVVGRNESIGMRALINLPGAPGFFQSLNLGLDYQHTYQRTTIPGATAITIEEVPLNFIPFVISYSGTWVQPGAITEFNADLNFSVRGFGDTDARFENSRYKATGSYIYLRADLAHTHDLPGGFQIYGKVQGQIADQPLVSTEQYAVGGMSTVRGYTEAVQVGDNGVAAQLELRSPSLLGLIKDKKDEWRVFAFADAGYVTLNDALPEQQSNFKLASYGFGTRLTLFDHINGEVDAAVPLTTQAPTNAHDVRVNFRIEAEF
ncbi:MAG: ShlB/FhaC/HecB family hemolysin secretion/activation protein [Chthoniobacteraceae bacterium]